MEVDWFSAFCSANSCHSPWNLHWEKKEKVCESLVTQSLTYQLLYNYLLYKLDALYMDTKTDHLTLLVQQMQGNKSCWYFTI